jgi:hypothetical protein
MKKTLIFLCCISLLAVYGCGGDNATPEDFGKNYVKKKFSGIKCDLDDLDISVSEDEENKATVTIEGEIKYEETLSLVKKGDKWILASDAAKLPQKAKDAPKKTKDAPKKTKSEKKASH